MDKIKQLILRLGIRSTYKGFLYLAYALTLCMQDESYLLSIYTRLYADVADLLLHLDRLHQGHGIPPDPVPVPQPCEEAAVDRPDVLERLVGHLADRLVGPHVPGDVPLRNVPDCFVHIGQQPLQLVTVPIHRPGGLSLQGLRHQVFLQVYGPAPVGNPQFPLLLRDLAPLEHHLKDRLKVPQASCIPSDTSRIRLPWNPGIRFLPCRF